MTSLLLTIGIISHLFFAATVYGVKYLYDTQGKVIIGTLDTTVLMASIFGITYFWLSVVMG